MLVQDFEDAGQVHAEVGTVFGGVVLEVEAEGVAIEKVGILGEQAEEHADK